MDSQTSSAAEEMRAAEKLPQADASDLVDAERLQHAVKDMYGHVARVEDSELHFEVGRPLAERLSYPAETLDRVPAEAIASFAGVGYHLDLAGLRPGEAVLDHVVFAEAARVLRPGGRLAVADIVSAKPLKERTRRNVDLWAACVAGAIPWASYAKAIEDVGLEVGAMRRNDYEFVSDRALEACSTYEIESVSLVARKLA